jgi:hypothetical protein
MIRACRRRAPWHSVWSRSGPEQRTPIWGVPASRRSRRSARDWRNVDVSGRIPLSKWLRKTGDLIEERGRTEGDSFGFRGRACAGKVLWGWPATPGPEQRTPIWGVRPSLGDSLSASPFGPQPTNERETEWAPSASPRRSLAATPSTAPDRSLALECRAHLRLAASLQAAARPLRPSLRDPRGVPRARLLPRLLPEAPPVFVIECQGARSAGSSIVSVSASASTVASTPSGSVARLAPCPKGNP